MGKDKLRRFAELHTFHHVLESDVDDVLQTNHPVRGNWHEQRFKNLYPIVLELGCGKGEYAVKLAEVFPEKNFIGTDIKGNRMWVGAKLSLERKMANIQFLRARIEFICRYFAENEVDEIWITFPDPQMQRNRMRKRLTSPTFLNNYKKLLKPGGIVHLKTDSDFLFRYTLEVIRQNNLTLILCTDDLYNSQFQEITLGVKTHYEQIYLSRGQAIHYLQFTLDAKETIDEPKDFE